MTASAGVVDGNLDVVGRWEPGKQGCQRLLVAKTPLRRSREAPSSSPTHRARR
ncbi:MAG: hypothetical protein R2991_01765 [Thermoanaerobaculia bacterium]